MLRALVRAFVVKRPSELAEYRVCISPDGHERHSVLVWGDLFEYCNLELMALGLKAIEDSKAFRNAICSFKLDGEAPLLDGESHTNSAHFSVDRSRYPSISRSHTWSCDPLAHTLLCVNSVSERAAASHVLARGQPWDGRRLFDALWQSMGDGVEGAVAWAVPAADSDGVEAGLAHSGDQVGGALWTVALAPAPAALAPAALAPAARAPAAPAPAAPAPAAPAPAAPAPAVPAPAAPAPAAPAPAAAPTMVASSYASRFLSTPHAASPPAAGIISRSPLSPLNTASLLPQPPQPSKLSKIDQAFEDGRQVGQREMQQAHAKEQMHAVTRLVSSVEYDLERQRVVFRIQGGVGARVALRLRRVVTQPGDPATTTTMSFTDAVEVAVLYPGAPAIGANTGGDGGSGGGCIYCHDPAGALPGFREVTRRTGWLTLQYELAASYGLVKNGYKVLTEDELIKMGALYKGYAATHNIIELEVLLETQLSDPEKDSQDSQGSGFMQALFPVQEVEGEEEDEQDWRSQPPRAAAAEAGDDD